MNIIGKSEVTAKQMAAYLIDKNPNAKPWAEEYAKLYLEEGAAEGVRGDGAWIQSCKETGNFEFIGGTAVTFDQNNFCGLGVTRKGMKGHSFDTPRLGIRAQMQHLKGYATADPLVNPCIDPRYGYISPKGKAPRWEDLAGKWAVPGYNTNLASSLEEAMAKGIGYGFDIIAGIEKMKTIKVEGDVPVETPKTEEAPKEEIFYVVQAGAFKNESKAHELKDDLNKKGSFNSIVKLVDGLYYVQVGVYRYKSNAETVKTRMNNLGFAALIKTSNSIQGIVSSATTPVEPTEPKEEVKVEEPVEKEEVKEEEPSEEIKNESNNEVVKVGYKVAIDAGHGSNTAGKRTPDGYREHWINVKCANYTDIALRRCGFETVKIAWDDTDATNDTDVALATRQSQIKAAKCDISVSIHGNAHGNGQEFTSVKGVETFAHTESAKVGDSIKLATYIQEALLQGTAQTNRGVKKSNLAMCNCKAMGTKASVLTELGFMTNEYEATLMKSDAFCLESAEEIAQGVCKYFGVSYVKPGNTPVSNSKPSTVEVPLKVTADKASVQKFLNTYYGNEIKDVLGKLLDEDGKFGNKSKTGLAIAIQVELNKRGASLAVDGLIGSKSATAFDTLVGKLQKNSKGLFVTLWQCVLVGHGIDPNGIDGIFGNGCASATNTLFGQIGVSKDASVSGADINAVL